MSQFFYADKGKKLESSSGCIVSRDILIQFVPSLDVQSWHHLQIVTGNYFVKNGMEVHRKLHFRNTNLVFPKWKFQKSNLNSGNKISGTLFFLKNNNILFFFMKPKKIIIFWNLYFWNSHLTFENVILGKSANR